MTLNEELCAVLNRHCAESGSNTPDFVLANFLLATLEAYNDAVRDRDRWYGISPSPGAADQQGVANE